MNSIANDLYNKDLNFKFAKIQVTAGGEKRKKNVHHSFRHHWIMRKTVLIEIPPYSFRHPKIVSSRTYVLWVQRESPAIKFSPFRSPALDSLPTWFDFTYSRHEFGWTTKCRSVPRALSSVISMTSQITRRENGGQWALSLWLNVNCGPGNAISNLGTSVLSSSTLAIDIWNVSPIPPKLFRTKEYPAIFDWNKKADNRMKNKYIFVIPL